MNHSHSLVRLWSLTLLLLIPFSGTCPADTAGRAIGTTVEATPEIINARLKEVEASSTLDGKTSASLTELYRKSLSNLEAASASETAAGHFSRARETAADQAHKILEKLEKAKKVSPTVRLPISEKAPLVDIEQQLLKEKANQAAIDAKLSELEQQLADQAERPNAARQRLTEARHLQEQLNDELNQQAPASETPALSEARRWNLVSRRQALSAEIKMLDQELLSEPMRIDLLKAQIEQADRSNTRTLERVARLEELLTRRRRAEAEQAQAETEADVTKLEAKNTHPLVQMLAERNATLSDQLSAASAELEKVASGDQAAINTAKTIKDEFRNTRQKLEIAGLSQALGQVLLEQRSSLPDLRSFRQKAKQRERMIANSSLLQIQFNEERKRLRDVDTYVDNLVGRLPPKEADKIRADLTDLAKKRRDLLDKAISLSDSYLRALGELDYEQRRLVDVVEAYDAFLAERLLWVRSAPPPSLALLTAFPAQAYGLIAPANWLGIIKVLLFQLNHSANLWLTILLFAILLWKTPWMRNTLQDAGKKVIKPRSDHFRYTLRALALTLLLAAPWPLLLAVVGWELHISLESTEFARAISHAFMLLSPAFFYLRAFRTMCLPGGLADAHFRWPKESLQALRHELRQLMLTFLPAAFVAVAVINHSVASFGGGLGRFSFALMMLSLMVFFYRLFGPNQKTLRPFLARHPDGTLARIRFLWLSLALVLPLSLTGLAFSGYLYTAGILTGSLIDTLWLTLGFIVIHQLAVRWLLMTRRKLAFEAAVERRQAAREAKQSSEPAEGDGETSSCLFEEPEIDLFALNEESRKLLNTILPLLSVIGLWFIWSDVLPAFAFLDNVSLWHYTEVIAGEEKLVPVTLADLLLAVLTIIVTVVASRRFPALLEIIMLQRFSVSSGGRYAITALSRYTIAAIGTLLTFSTIGASWSQIQWLAAALTVGIGFGLQEIVANFISGIIILFERPIRVGDVITVGDTNGVVTRIQIRATTIRNWDRQELLVPNKEFITGRLLNWSLSDQITRLKVPVGVAYGSDVEKAMLLMNEAALEDESVLEDPKPSIIFEAFGDNALNLVLRCFVGSQEARMPTLTRLHQAINRKFNAANIVIAFPQRDVHLDTSRPLNIRISHNDEAE
ncbi:MAG TPA: mechanosensitive ion channel [Gammaproteobacteria bacterium]|nr:mechanosensitive ion channel [Gammaproteobacteria bacterium]